MKHLGFAYLPKKILMKIQKSDMTAENVPQFYHGIKNMLIIAFVIIYINTQ